ncbi:hypothetical protein A3I27_03430 [Candidatus Giovannonibacteria bacterium RIFCSPLOWO2_02_FULL_43_11b]|uniref:Uncharacterized protein n=1 Tax=Candidatus Giovannonibacteria bacterium RIFCSPHIGHO2_12_FULL_43_15 TaxID=1798341 RepID=A0A1F5WR05_9BACT|nr:MAG: hypothetical protein A2739_02795 [Candidatus Giovannonibacteria bacterium RIFCSPHIGHO2_01_FULL_43_100]OGF78050.1 MAG: hypothetical protein A3F23_02150 [Candidatus Giovannonibacteria bacterium RIFCSPHIGHO2_12_FULL_43_15]OGF78382.1 MAG: hypothetical protein A3A15_02435 [Candidatus Giovannonibacteria bacterium RIFCSPLOWO2_01_FULL_43_60]OGF89042.1 MAG: hypothetical protein A3I27_03430 [Candidatus Giovannonibacteria bacterium RIFCSPLOWO2_02_FULL_43_11b]OGF91447.1 MAG: hypothetical protein A3
MTINPQNKDSSIYSIPTFQKSLRFIAGLFLVGVIPLLTFIGAIILDSCGTTLGVVAQGGCGGDVLGPSELTILLSFLISLIVIILAWFLSRHRFKYFAQGILSALVIFILLSILLFIKFS